MENQDRVHLWSDGQTGLRAETKLPGLGSPPDSPQGLSSPPKGLLIPAQPRGLLKPPSSLRAVFHHPPQLQPQLLWRRCSLPSGHAGGSGSSAQGIWFPQSGGFSPLRHMEFWKVKPKRSMQVHVPGMLRKGRIFTSWARAMVAGREADMGEDRHQGGPLGTHTERERSTRQRHSNRASPGQERRRETWAWTRETERSAPEGQPLPLTGAVGSAH